MPASVISTRSYRLLLIGLPLSLLIVYSCGFLNRALPPASTNTVPAVSATSTLISSPSPASTLASTPELGLRSSWRTSRLAFASNRTGRFQIYLMRPDGSGLTQLTNSAGDNTSPAWSMDARHIYFVSTRDGNAEIYSMEPDGMRQNNLTRSASKDTMPLALPAGKVAFVSDRKGRERIFVMDEGGADVQSFPYSSVDSTVQIVCLSWLDEGRVFFSTEENGQRKTQILDTANGEVWIPDLLASPPDRSCPNVPQFVSSDWTMFITNRDGHDEIYGFREKVEEDVPFTHGLKPSTGITRSTDGTWLAFYSSETGNWDVYVMSIFGKSQWDITNTPADDIQPAWEPY